ncbi:LysR family transcriptional regulator [uncultured Roseibium sp.]|uniref:LysR family transcriptional regulator n=1 Tax=uncultured Roseibium sp. TaxID=1936171 RepID=UPI00260AAF8B|nr:LysR family transcriptional regulator [uncultured Roseibium sp.]
MARRKNAFSGTVSGADIRLMRVFKTVIECSGLSAAQTELGVGASTISRQISDLETRLGIRLCHRGRSGFSLTQQGEIALEHIERLLAAADEFATSVASINRQLVGKIDIGMIDYTLSDERNPLVSAIRRFKDDAPEVDVSLMTGTPAEVERAVIDGKLHFGIVPDYQRHPSLKYRRLYDEEVGLFCAGEHPMSIALSAGEPLSEAEILEHALVYRGYFESSMLRNLKQKFPVGTIVFQTEAVLALVGAGVYLGFFPTHCTSQALYDFKELRPDIFRYSSPICAIWRGDRHQSAVLQQFLELITVD